MIVNLVGGTTGRYHQEEPDKQPTMCSLRALHTFLKEATGIG